MKSSKNKKQNKIAQGFLIVGGMLFVIAALIFIVKLIGILKPLGELVMGGLSLIKSGISSFPIEGQVFIYAIIGVVICVMGFKLFNVYK